jgi:hypothetical protein
MDVSPNALRKETAAVLVKVDLQMKEIEVFARQRDIQPSAVIDSYGNYPMIPLLLAKSQCLATLTALNEQGVSRSQRRGTQR